MTNVTSVPLQRHLPEKPTLLRVQIVVESLVLSGLWDVRQLYTLWKIVLEIDH